MICLQPDLPRSLLEKLGKWLWNELVSGFEKIVFRSDEENVGLDHYPNFIIYFKHTCLASFRINQQKQAKQGAMKDSVRAATTILKDPTQNANSLQTPHYFHLSCCNGHILKCTSLGMIPTGISSGIPDCIVLLQFQGNSLTPALGVTLIRQIIEAME